MPADNALNADDGHQLKGPEIRKQWSGEYAQMYLDLDHSFIPITFFFPNLPNPMRSKCVNVRVVVLLFLEKSSRGCFLKLTGGAPIIISHKTHVALPARLSRDDEPSGLKVCLMMPSRLENVVSEPCVLSQSAFNADVLANKIDTLDASEGAGNV